MKLTKVNLDKPKRKRPVGQVIPTQHGFGVRRWNDAEPLVANLASKKEAFKFLYALSNGWSSITVTFWNGSTTRINLQQWWGWKGIG